MMKGKYVAIGVLACGLFFSTILLPAADVNVVEAATSNYHITYKLPSNPEKYLFLNVQMVSIANPQVAAMQRPYSRGDYLIDMDGGGSYETKTAYTDNLRFLSSKKGFLWNIYHFIGILPPYYPPNVNLDDLDQRIQHSESYSKERELRETRAQIQMNARLRPLIDAGYVKAEEIDEGIATKEFVATVLYRMFGKVRPYHGGIDLKDTENTAVRWAVEIGLPGFMVDSEGYLYPQTPLSMDPGRIEYPQEYAYDRLFHFITLILPGKRTSSGWEYYQAKLLPGMVPMRTLDIITVNGRPYSLYEDYFIMDTKEFQSANTKVAQFSTARFAQMLDLARKDALKPRVWNWSRDLIHNPRFAKEIASYRKNRNNLNAVYQAVRKHYNLSIQQDSAVVIKSVLDNVK